MNYDECPVDVMQKWDKTKGIMVLVLQPPPANYKPVKEAEILVISTTSKPTS